jgi:hypothetical protein
VGENSEQSMNRFPSHDHAHVLRRNLLGVLASLLANLAAAGVVEHKTRY